MQQRTAGFRFNADLMLRAERFWNDRVAPGSAHVSKAARVS
jgi:hypothetical protein